MTADVPKWLLPWVFPLVVVVGLIMVAVSVWLGMVVLLVLVVGVVRLRLRYLKQNPPDPELRHRNFWDLR